MRKFLLIFLLSIFAVSASMAQIQQAFFMDNTPVSRTYNIVMNPTWGMYVGVPISDFNLGVNTTGANFGDIFFKENGDYTTIFDNDLSDARKQKFLSDIDDEVLLGTDMRFTPFAFGITNERSSFGFSITQRLDIQSNMPASFFEAVLMGTDAVADGTDMSGLSLAVKTFTEIGLLIRTEINDNFAVAIRPKILSGSGFVEIFGNRLVVDNDILEADITGNIAGAMKLTINEDGTYEDIEFDYESFGKNIGFGVDLAASFSMDKLDLSAGVNDIGFIKWKENAYAFTGTGELDFDGEEGVSDEFEESLYLNQEVKSFRTSLNAVPFVSARYQLTDALSGGALLYGNKIGDKYKPFLTLGVNFAPVRFLETAVTYTLREKSFTNLGVALSARLGAIQLYLASDNLLSVIDHEKANYFNVRTGLNFVFGQRRSLKKEAAE